MEEPTIPISSLSSEHDSSPPSSSSSTSSSPLSSSPLPLSLSSHTSQPRSLVQPSNKNKHKPAKVFRVFRSMFRSFPIITPTMCKMPSHSTNMFLDGKVTHSGYQTTGTLFGHRKGRISLSIQENPRTLPTLVVELAMQTNVLQKEMSLGMVRIALECEKRLEKGKKIKLLQEPVWTMFCNGKKTGYASRREASEEDLRIMELLKAVSMGAGVLPGKSGEDGQEMEMAYIRAHFEHAIGSKNSETFYMMSPGGNNGPELSIFFVRI
ncbi:protein MIZU-KUSSEI 1-like [Impatiens glandulifera]|uniref:protein MIZU-KUSSEI 1-like n=1 Tax=Impatiens glandulifera TaxID=253017 RepID=UPI001FB0C27F|nr:protein MIZU-KUSSEI 1-like [Impatiens glandulifera]